MRGDMMSDQTVVTHDDVTRWLDGAAQAVAALLPENDGGGEARYYAESLAIAAHRSLDEAGVPRTTAPDE